MNNYIFYEQAIKQTNDKQQIIKILEYMEQDLSLSDFPQEYCTLLILLYLVEWEIPTARFLYYRNNNKFQESIIGKPILDILKSAFTNNFKDIHQQYQCLVQYSVQIRNELIKDLIIQLGITIQNESKKYIENNFINISKCRYESLTNSSQNQNFIEIQKSIQEEKDLKITKISELARMIHQKI